MDSKGGDVNRVILYFGQILVTQFSSTTHVLFFHDKSDFNHLSLNYANVFDGR